MSLSKIETSSLDVGQIGGRRNLIINGDFSIWQRGTSFTNNTSPKYTADRWQVYGAGSSILDITRQSFSAGQTDVEGNPRYYIRLDNTPDADSTWMELFQRVEDVTYFSNVPVTLSFWIRSNRNITNQNYFSFVQNFGSGGSSNVSTASSNFDISTSWEKKTLNVTLPSIAGKTVGAGSYLEIHLLQPSSVQADTYYDIANVQLEVGTVATPFEHRSYGEELRDCYRYYWELSANRYGVNGFLPFNVWMESSGALKSSFGFPVDMRAIPTISVAGSWFIDGGPSGNPDITWYGSSSTTKNSARVEFTGSFTSLDSGSPRYKSSDSKMAFDAEL